MQCFPRQNQHSIVVETNIVTGLRVFRLQKERYYMQVFGL